MIDSASGNIAENVDPARLPKCVGNGIALYSEAALPAGLKKESKIG